MRLFTSWLRYIGWGRVLIAAVALVLGFVFPPAFPVAFQVLTAVFLIWATVLAVRLKGLRGVLGLAALAVDTLFFLVLAIFGSVPLLWPAAVFFLYLLIEALAFYSPIELLVVSGICAAVCAFAPGPRMREIEPTVVVSGALACGLAAGRERQQSALADLQGRMVGAERFAEKAREEERQRIASDFHDGPLQSFISLQMRLEILRKLMERDLHAGMADLLELQQLAQSQVRDLRTFLHSMRPVEVGGGNFVAVARRMAESFQKESGIAVTFLGGKTPVGLPQETTLEVLQMLRESLHNVQKHAAATRVAVSLEKTGRGIEISIDDNGHGFPFSGSYTLEELDLLRLGPVSLKRRARALNADLLLESHPGRGSGLKFRIPLQ